MIISMHLERRKTVGPTLVALAALDTLSRAGLGAVGDLVATLSAVLAGELVDTGDGTCSR